MGNKSSIMDDTWYLAYDSELLVVLQSWGLYGRYYGHKWVMQLVLWPQGGS